MNVVLAIADTLRSDFLGYNGNGWISTPRLDRLAAQSIVFDRFYVGNSLRYRREWTC